MPNLATFLPCVFPAVILGVIALAWYLNRRAERRRTEALAAVADSLGFEFHPAGDPVLQSWLSGFDLFSRGHSQRLWNVLRGRTRDLDVAVFDYKYVTGHGKHARTWRTTVICFRAAGLDLPVFRLRPATFWQRLGVGLFGYQDINFDSHPAFSKVFLLRGPDEPAVRAVFPPEVLDHFERAPDASTEGEGDTLLFYRHAARVDPARVRDFMEEGFAVLGLFRPAGEAS